MGLVKSVVVAGAVLTLAADAWADSHTTGAPVLNSRPGAAYTLYLDFGGFNYTGVWWTSTPGNLVAFNSASSTGTFTTTEQDYIRNVWARVSEKYVGLNINVTTVDPAVAAGQNGTDAKRQAYYDQQARMMHTVVTSATVATNPFIDGAGGISRGGTQYSYTTAGINNGAGPGQHTNWVFTDQLGNQGTGTVKASTLKLIGECGAHENGHGLGLDHQSSYTGTTKTEEYASNGNSGVVRPIMGNSYYSTRGTWRTGPTPTSSTTVQNDLQVILANGGMGAYADDGIGHTQATASGLATSFGSGILTTAASGYIAPKGSTPNAIGFDNYTTDFYKFFTVGGAVNITINEAAQRLASGTADPGGMLDSYIELYDAAGNYITDAGDRNTQTSTISRALPAGSYYFQVSSRGGTSSTGNETASYFDMGSYFLSGTITQSANALYFTGAHGTNLLTNLSGLGGTNFSNNSDGSFESFSVPGATTDVFFSASNGVTTANLSTTLTSSLAVNSVTFGIGKAANVGLPVTISGGGTLTLNAATTSGYGSPTGVFIARYGPQNTIATPVALGASQRWVNDGYSGFVVSGPVSLGTNTLTLAGVGSHSITGVISGSGGVTSTTGGVARLSAANTYTGVTKVDSLTGGSLRIGVNARNPAINGGCDIARGSMLFEYSGSSIAGFIRLYLQASRNAATTPGVMDSGYVFSSTSTLTRGVGYREDGESLILRPALFGDADMDGGVSINDFNALAANFGQPSNRVWTQGDFDYDGGVSINDFNLLASAFGQTMPAGSTLWADLLTFAAANNDMAAFQAVTGVPEPTTLGVVTAGLLLGLRRRRHA